MRRWLIIALFPLLLSSCGGEESSEDVPVVTGARSALVETTRLLQKGAMTVRPAALLSIYVNILLADSTSIPVFAARQGVDVQLQLHRRPTDESIDDLYAFLDEFGAVLHVDLIELLNRSPDRAKTLGLYLTGLQNITERSRRRSGEIEQNIGSLKEEEKEQRKTVKTLERDSKEATKTRDYTTAGDLQKELAKESEELSKIELQLDELKTVQEIFVELLEIADQRIKAIESNREILIAGLRVVDVPGVEDLGVIEEARDGRRRRSGGVSPFGAL